MKLESILIELGVTSKDIDKARAYQAKFGGVLEKILINMGSLPEEALKEIYCRYLSCPGLDDSEFDDFEWKASSCSAVFNLEFMKARGWLPLRQDSDSCWLICTKSPLNLDVIQYLTGTGIHYNLIIADDRQFDQLISLTESNVSTDNEQTQLSNFEEDRLREMASEAPTVNLLNSLINRALKNGASDMHIEPHQGRYRVRFRIDGVLHDIEFLPPRLELPIISRLKILSNMDIAERRRPQDGKIEMKISNIELDIRVSSLPLNSGESLVLRFLRKDSIKYDVDVLSLAKDVETKIREDLQHTSGVILLTGPTGSGKTTSLYTFLNELNNEEVKIITLEDPVEYQLDGINQVQVKPEIGFDFTAGLRSIVRQDPDIIMVGEIRDKETARIAMQSALTGHLVFSTVHTNDAPSAFTRLIDLGVEPFLLNAAIVSIIAQRLARKVCPHCAIAHPESTEIIEKYDLEKIAKLHNIDHMDLRKSKGCEYCSHTGYKGRVAVIEYLRCDENIRRLPKDDQFISLARQHNASIGGRNLLEDGLLKAIQGITTIDEVVRVCG